MIGHYEGFQWRKCATYTSRLRSKEDCAWSKVQKLGLKVRVESRRRLKARLLSGFEGCSAFQYSMFFCVLALWRVRSPALLDPREVPKHRSILMYCGVLYFLLRMHTASISCLSTPEYKSRVARLTLTPKQDFRQKKCDFIRREMEGGHKARQEVTTLIGHIA